MKTKKGIHEDVKRYNIFNLLLLLLLCYNLEIYLNTISY